MKSNIFKSYVLLEIVGLNVERLINNFLKWNVEVLHINRESKDCFYLKTSFFSYKKLLEKTKHTCYNISVKRYFGVLAFFNFLKKRAAIFVSILLVFSLYIFSQLFVWKIEIYGLDNLTRQQIMEVLEENNAKIGKKLSFLNLSDLEYQLYNKLDDIGLVSVVKKGTTLIINIQEKINTNVFDNLPITAQFDGVIQKIVLITGTLMVKEGDVVKKGDILVAPYYINGNKKIEITASAEIYAKTETIATVQFAETQEVFVQTGNKKTFNSLMLWKWEIFKPKLDIPYKNYDIEENTKYLFKYFILPIKKKQITVYETVSKMITKSYLDEKENLEKESLKKANDLLPSGQEVLETKTITSKQNGKYYITTYLITIRRID